MSGTLVSGDNFGFDADQFYVTFGNSVGSTYTPITSWTWNSTDLASIGLGALSSTPVVAYTLDNGDTINFASSSVPEPTSAFLLALGTFGCVALRRRP